MSTDDADLDCTRRCCICASHIDRKTARRGAAALLPDSYRFRFCVMYQTPTDDADGLYLLYLTISLQTSCRAIRICSSPSCLPALIFLWALSRKYSPKKGP